MFQTTLRQGTYTVVLLAGLIGASPAMQAQPAASIQSVTTYRVKPDRVTEWQDLRKQVVAIYKKAGLDNNSTVWMSQSGPLEYGVARYYSKWAELDAGPSPKLKEHTADLRGLNSRMMQCVESMERRLGTVMDWSLRGSPSEMPKMVSVMKVTVRQGHLDPYLELAKSESMPAYKKSGAKLVLHVRPVYGSSTNEATVITAMDGWAARDETHPLVKALGEDGFAALTKKYNEHVVRRESTVYRYMPALSYIVGGGGAGPATGN
jgi:hypothetical protein